MIQNGQLGNDISLASGRAWAFQGTNFSITPVTRHHVTLLTVRNWYRRVSRACPALSAKFHFASRAFSTTGNWCRSFFFFSSAAELANFVRVATCLRTTSAKLAAVLAGYRASCLVKKVWRRMREKGHHIHPGFGAESNISPAPWKFTGKLGLNVKYPLIKRGKINPTHSDRASRRGVTAEECWQMFTISITAMRPRQCARRQYSTQSRRNYNYLCILYGR